MAVLKLILFSSLLLICWQNYRLHRKVKDPEGNAEKRKMGTNHIGQKDG